MCRKSQRSEGSFSLFNKMIAPCYLTLESVAPQASHQCQNRRNPQDKLCAGQRVEGGGLSKEEGIDGPGRQQHISFSRSCFFIKRICFGPEDSQLFEMEI